MRLRQVLLLMRNVEEGLKFYGPEGLGLTPRFVTDQFAELSVSNNGNASDVTIALQAVEREADCSTGYSPIMRFDVDDMDSTIQRLMMLGGRLDGPIKYPIEGKLASVRTPDGHMIGLFERNPDLERFEQEQLDKGLRPPTPPQQ